MNPSAQQNFQRLILAGLLLCAAAMAGTAVPASAQCVGDCNADSQVPIHEVQRCVNIRTGFQPLASCPNADGNGDGSVDENDVDDCIQSFLNPETCPQVSVPTATSTAVQPTATNTAVQPTPTNTAPVPTATSTSAVPPTTTHTNTPASTSTPTRTNTAAPTSTRTNTPPPTSTPTNTQTNTAVPTNTAAVTNTPAVHTCNFNGATTGNESSLQICFLGVCPAPFDISGAVKMGCDPGTQQGNGTRDCACELVNLNPFILTGVGTICVSPGTGACPSGEVDCDGGTALNVDLIGEHLAGACTSNANCATTCGTYCSGINKVVYNSGCELQCQGGTRANQPCICDTAGAATCSGGMAGVNDCPLGSCEGKDNDLGTAQCHCTCVNEAFGAASPAGALNCRVGVTIVVEAMEDGICDGNVLVRLPPQCAPFTSATASGILLNDNENAGNLGPYSETGANGSCAQIDAGNLSGYELVSVLAFFDSTIGDIISRLQIDCQ